MPQGHSAHRAGSRTLKNHIKNTQHPVDMQRIDKIVCQIAPEVYTEYITINC